MATPASLERRVERVEDVLSEWEAVCRVRCKGVPAIQAEARRLMESSKELWRLKEAAPGMIWPLIRLALEQATRNPQDLEKLKGEFDNCLRPENLQGIFPVGNPGASADAVDLKFKPGLPAMRFNHFLWSVIGPAPGASMKPNLRILFSCGVPLASAVLKKRKRKGMDAEEGGPGKGPGKGKGAGSGASERGGGGGRRSRHGRSKERRRR